MPGAKLEINDLIVRFSPEQIDCLKTFDNPAKINKFLRVPTGPISASLRYDINGDTYMRLIKDFLITMDNFIKENKYRDRLFKICVI